MGENSAIEWTDHTFNPWWGCSHAGSPGCDNCYAKDQAERFGFDCWGRGKARRLLSEKNWEEPYRWNRAAEKAGKMARVFCGSMCDYLDPEAPAGLRDKMFQIIGETPWLFWMLLTKRPEEMMMRMNPKLWTKWENYALGVTVENQRQDWRVHEMLTVKAPYYFVSHEPALGPVTWPKELLNLGSRALIITGGESGDKARPMHPDWARWDRDQCLGRGTSYCFKQWGEWRPAVKGDPLNCKKSKLIRQDGSEISMHETFDPVCGDEVMFLVGKNAAGRVLDGRIWNERLV